MKENIKWHTVPEFPKIGEKCLLIYYGELSDSIWECQDINPKAPNTWVTYIENDHYTTGYPEVSAWLSLRELEESYHNQINKQ